MQRYLISEPADAILSMLADALDLVDFGIVLLNHDLRARFINRCFLDMWDLPPELIATGPSFRDLLQHGAAHEWYDVPAAGVPACLDEREAQVRAGSIPPTRIKLADRRDIVFRCVACADGGRILTYADISQELRLEALEAEARVSAEIRFNSELLTDQAANLATLAEAADESARMADAARLLLEHEVFERRQLEVDLRRLATTDGLTGALNRSEFLASAQRAMDAQQGIAQKIVLLMVDADHFKAINDNFGHAGGDCALQHLVTSLRAGLRQTDLVGRLGGEEFAVLLADTQPGPAEMVAERLRARVADAPVAFGERLIPMTVSIGLAIQHETDRSIDEVLARADNALYRAKHSGRNRVVADQETEAA